VADNAAEEHLDKETGGNDPPAIEDSEWQQLPHA
jgi:hypothetical protein